MKCPQDGTDLVHVVRQGVGIDHCPRCHGVWLDRGELEKIIEAATPAVVLPEPDTQLQDMTPPRPPQPGPVVMQDPTPGARPSRSGDDEGDDDGYRHARRYSKTRRKGFLSELFDALDLD